MDDKLFQQLKKVPLFSSITDDELSLIYEKLQLVRFKRDDVIIREGDLGDCFYIIKSGRVRVETHPEEVDHPIVLARLEDGDYFGEMALITGEPRSASVIAEDEVELWRLLKSDFDQLIMRNPNITLSLTHMLSHRLIKTNRALEKTELQFLKKIHPSGKIKDFGLVRILQFAEQNALTGKIVLRQDGKEAVFDYEKGQLLRLQYGDMEEDQALDELLKWEEGTFSIEPEIFQLEPETVSENPEWSEQEKQKARIFEQFLRQKITEFIQFAGSRATQMAVKKAYMKLGPVFDDLQNVHIEVQPDLHVEFSELENFNERHVLLLAMILNQIVHYLSREVIGMEFWDVRTNDPAVNELLENEKFYVFFEQAEELV